METNTTTDINSTQITDTFSEITDVTKMTHALNESFEEMILSKLPIPESVIELFSMNLFGNTLVKWTTALVVSVIFLLLRIQLSRLVTLIALRCVHKRNSTLDDELLYVLQRPIELGMIILGFNVAFSFLKFGESFSVMISQMMSTLTIVLITWVLYRVIKLCESTNELISNRIKTDNGITMTKLMLSILKATVLIIAGINILANCALTIT